MFAIHFDRRFKTVEKLSTGWGNMSKKQFRLATQADIGKVVYFTDRGPEFEIRPIFERVLAKAYPFGMGVEKPYESADGFRYAYAYLPDEPESLEETVKQMIETLATAVAASTNTIVRINNQVTALRSELQDARNAIEEIKQRLDENDRIERECR